MKRVFVTAIFMLIASCSTTYRQPLPIDYSYKNMRIGFISGISAKPVYAMTPWFGNTTKETDLDDSWELNKYIFNVLKEPLESKYCYELIDLSSTPGAEEYLLAHKRQEYQSQYWRIDSSVNKKIKEEYAPHKLDGIIFIVGH